MKLYVAWRVRGHAIVNTGNRPELPSVRRTWADQNNRDNNGEPKMRNRRLTLARACSIGLIAAFWAPAAHAQTTLVVVDETFDDDTVGELPSPYFELIAGECGSFELAVSDEASLSPSHSLKLQNTCFDVPVDAVVPIPACAQDLVGATWVLHRKMEVFSFSVMTLNGEGTNNNGVFWFGDGTIRVRGDGVSFPTTVIDVYVPGVFRKVETRWDFTTLTYDVFIDDSFRGTFPAITGANRAQIGSNQPVIFYDDDVLLQVEYLPRDEDSNGIDDCVGCPCEAEWRNHGAYVSCVAHEAQRLVDEGLLEQDQYGEVVSEAARSDCGR